jgi:hypothetical protein
MATKLKLGIAAALSAALLTGGAVAAAPAFAADPALGNKTFHVAVTHPGYGHYDLLHVTPVSKSIVSRAGLKAHRSYSVTLKDGKKLLFSGHLGATKTLLLTVDSEQRYYKSDAALAARARAVAKESDAKASRDLTALVKALRHDGRISKLQADVASTKVNVAVLLAEDGQPSDFTNDQIANSLGKSETVVVTFLSDGNFTVVGTDTVTKIQVTFNSSTGVTTQKHLK